MRRTFALGLGLTLLGALAAPARADHSWNDYHWSSDGVAELTIIDSMDGNGWDPLLDAVIADWNASARLVLTKQDGSIDARDRRKCDPVLGAIRACNASFGFRNWIGIAQVWVSGGHIAQATTKVNDSWLDGTIYDTNEVKQYVLCQEIGHDFGLDHQPAGAESCMNDRADIPDEAYPSPNSHDYDMLNALYHDDEQSDGGGSDGGDGGDGGDGDGGDGGGNCPPKSNSPKCNNGQRHSYEVSRDGPFTLITITTWA